MSGADVFAALEAEVERRFFEAARRGMERALSGATPPPAADPITPPSVPEKRKHRATRLAAGTPPRRTPAELTALANALLLEIRRAPGSTIIELAAALTTRRRRSVATRDLVKPIEILRRRASIRDEGIKVHKRYFARSAP